MISNLILTIATFVSVVLFPWPFAAVLSVVTAFFEPLIPFAAGLLADALYYSSEASRLPWFSICGLVVTVISILVRSRIRTM